MHTFIIRDVRLEGWKPPGDVIETNYNTPLSWVMDCIKYRGKKYGGDLKVIFMCHGLPGYLQCANGTALHPTCKNGITINDLGWFKTIAGSLKRLELYSCLVARIGGCPEANGHVGYDGNAFCFQLAQTIQAEVKASIHLQYYRKGETGIWIFKRPNGDGINFGEWNGKVFTWDKTGKIIDTQEFPYQEAS
jgi:hypothetical protein